MNLHDSAEHEYSYSFLDFTLDLAAERLVRGANEIKLRPKSFQVLRYLIERHGRLVTRDELMQAAWGDVAVTDESISKCIAEIRKALADDSQQIVRTVTRRGFLFQAEVRIEQPSQGPPQTPSFYPKRRVPAVSMPVVEFPRQTRDAEIEPGPLPVPPGRAIRRLLNRWIMTGAAAMLVVAAGALILLWPTRPAKQELTYEQITNFTDSAVSPALSPDGRMVAFYRSDDWWLTPDQIWVKLLPNGEPVQITHDPRAKYGLAFSPDSSRIAYTVSAAGWNTYTVSSLGGEPKLLLANAQVSPGSMNAGSCSRKYERANIWELSRGWKTGRNTAGYIFRGMNAAWRTSPMPRPIASGL